MKSPFLAPFLGLALLGCAVAVAQAQPDTQNAPKANNPTNGPFRPNLQNLTPEARFNEAMRRQFTLLGATVPAEQDALVLYLAGETTARQALTEKASQLQIGLRGNVLPDAQVATLLNDYLGAVEEDKTRQQTAFALLKKSVDLTKMPKVEAMLTLMGLANQAPALSAGGLTGGGRMGRAGQNFGGAFGGGGGFGGGGFGGMGGAFGAQPTMPRLNRRQNGPVTPAPPATPVAPAPGAVA